MAHLINFPVLNQLADRGEANIEFDCVPTCIAAGLQHLTQRRYTGAQVKDAVYGRKYTGGTAASAYVAYCAQQGAILRPVQGDGSQLVQVIRREVAQGHPVLATEPDPYADPHLGWSHVVIFFAVDEPPGTLTAMDPFGGHTAAHSYERWATIFEFREVWIMCSSREVVAKMVMVPDGWQDDGTTLTAPNGVRVVLGFREYVLAHAWEAENWPLEQEAAGQINNNETDYGSGSRQKFRCCTLLWTPSKGVFLAWLNTELAAMEQLLSEDLKKINFIKNFTTSLHALLSM